MHDKLNALQQYTNLTGMKPDTQDQEGRNNVIILPPLENEKDQLKRMRIYDVTPGSE